MLLFSITLYLILQAEKKSFMIQYAAIPLAASFVVRPTNCIPIFILPLFVFLYHRRYFLRFLLWAMPVTIPFLLFNLFVYHWPVSPYYLPQRHLLHPDYLTALTGTLFCPSRGLFIYSPVLFFSLYGIFVKLRKKNFTGLDYFVAGIIILHWILISSNPCWWAGHSFGPRYFGDIIPFFIYFLIPASENLFSSKGSKIMQILFFLSIAVSFWIHYRGANVWAVHLWNAVPDNIDQNASRLWDLRDIQFLRGITR